MWGIKASEVSYDLSGNGICIRQISGKTDRRGISKFDLYYGVSFDAILRIRARLMYENI